jgi:hypothetical protein
MDDRMRFSIFTACTHKMASFHYTKLHFIVINQLIARTQYAGIPSSSTAGERPPSARSILGAGAIAAAVPASAARIMKGIVASQSTGSEAVAACGAGRRHRPAVLERERHRRQSSVAPSRTAALSSWATTTRTAGASQNWFPCW